VTTLARLAKPSEVHIIPSRATRWISLEVDLDATTYDRTG
jgi:hypothetical protein